MNCRCGMPGVLDLNITQGLFCNVRRKSRTWRLVCHNKEDRSSGSPPFVVFCS